jgi:hypothetical protein
MMIREKKSMIDPLPSKGKSRGKVSASSPAARRSRSRERSVEKKRRPSARPRSPPALLFPHRRTHHHRTNGTRQPPAPARLRPPIRPSSRLRLRPRPRGGTEAKSPVVFASRPRKTPRGRTTSCTPQRARTPPPSSLPLPSSWRLSPHPTLCFHSFHPPADATPTPQLHPPPACQRHLTARLRAWAAAISPRLQPPARLAASLPFSHPISPLPHADPRGRASIGVRRRRSHDGVGGGRAVRGVRGRRVRRVPRVQLRALQGLPRRGRRRGTHHVRALRRGVRHRDRPRCVARRGDRTFAGFGRRQC